MNGITAMVAQMQNARPVVSAGHERSAYDRIIAIERLASGVSAQDVAREFGVKVCTVQRWQTKARKERE